MFCVAKHRQTSKQMYFLTSCGVNPSENTVYDALRLQCQGIHLTGCHGTYMVKMKLFNTVVSP